MLIEHLHNVSFRWYTQALSDNLVDSSLPQMFIQCLVCVPGAILGAWNLSGNRRDKKAISDSPSLDSSVCGEGWGGVLCILVMLQDSIGFCPQELAPFFPLMDAIAHRPKRLTSPCLSWFLYASETLNMLFIYLSCNASLYPHFLLFISQILASLSSCKWKVKMQVTFFSYP